MIKHLLSQKLQIISIIFIFIVSCGSDMVEDVVETFEFGDKKVYVRYHPDPNVLEKHIYNKAGEMIHLERDSLSYGDDFKHFMSGTWIVDKMTVDDEVVFEKDSIYNPQKPPNVYTFSGDSLLVSGPQYFANYKIEYLDSSQVERAGTWTYGIEGESTFRTQRVYDIDHFQITSYFTFIWTDFLEDTEKEEEVMFRRIILPTVSNLADTSLADTSIVTPEAPR